MNPIRYLGIVKAVAELSKDQSTKVGAVILGPGREIRSTGRNGFPRGVNDLVPERHERPLKYEWSCHAEENAITQAARSGVSCDGCTMLVYGLQICPACARMCIQAGIRSIYMYCGPVPERWKKPAEIALQMLREAGVYFSIDLIAIEEGDVNHSE